MPEINYRQNDQTVSVGPDNPLPVQFQAAPTIEQDGASVYVNAAVTVDVALALAAATGRRLLGYMVEENAAVAAAAEVRLRHGGVAGDLLFPVILAADGVAQAWFGPNGIEIPNGLSIDHVAGAVHVTLFYR